MKFEDPYIRDGDHDLTTKQIFICSKRKSCEICSDLTIKIPEQRQCCSSVFAINFEHVSHFFLVFNLLDLNRYMFVG